MKILTNERRVLPGGGQSLGQLGHLHLQLGVSRGLGLEPREAVGVVVDLPDVHLHLVDPPSAASDLLLLGQLLHTQGVHLNKFS